MSSKPIYFCVYRITNIVEKKYYYGYKSSDIHPSKILGITYFSSMIKDDGIAFKRDQKENPQNYKYKIIFIFDNKIDALTREIKLHSKFDVKNHPSFYNKSNQTSTGFDTTGIKPSDYNKQRTSETHKGVKRSPESVIKQSKTLTGRKLSVSHKQNLSKARKGKHYEKVSEVQRKYLYITPLGTFDYSRALESVQISKPTLQNWCRNNEKEITRHNYGHSPWLLANYQWGEIKGKTFKDIGFSFMVKPLDFLTSILS